MQTALELAKEATLILVGRSQLKLDKVKDDIAKAGGSALTVVCDLSEPSSVRKAAAEIITLNLTLTALINNAGLNTPHPTRNSLNWDAQWSTNHMGPFLLTSLLIPHLARGANILLLASGCEDPEHPIAKGFGFKGGRYINTEASARGEWAAGGSGKAGYDAYATSKQAALVACLALAREHPELRFNAVEPGFIPGSGLKDNNPWFIRVVMDQVMARLVPFMNGWSTPRLAGKLVAGIVANAGPEKGVYYDSGARPIQPSVQARQEEFQDRVVRETRALLDTVA